MLPMIDKARRRELTERYRQTIREAGVYVIRNAGNGRLQAVPARDGWAKTYSNGRGERVRADTPSPILLIPVANIPSYVGRVPKTA